MLSQNFADILRHAGIRHGTGVPCSLFTPLVDHMTQDPQLDYISAASEGEAVAIAAGLVTSGNGAFALMQNSGLGNAINPVTSLLCVYRIPVMLLVSHRGQPGHADEVQHRIMGEITEELSRLCGLTTNRLRAETFNAELESTLEKGHPAAWICSKGLFEDQPNRRSRPLEIFTGEAPWPQPRRLQPQLTREEALGICLPLLNGRGKAAEPPPAVISTTGKTSRELFELDDLDHSRENRFYMVGSMGCATGFGLGVAHGLLSAGCHQKVVIIDGDGSLLMKLGSLATVGSLRPKNLHHVVLDNGAHDSTGGQPTSSPTADLAAIALACGYHLADSVAAGDELADTLERHLNSPGPTLLRVAIKTGSRSELGRPTLTPPDVWARFRDFLSRTKPQDALVREVKS